MKIFVTIKNNNKKGKRIKRGIKNINGFTNMVSLPNSDKKLGGGYLLPAISGN